jgi:hypothetical protein
MTVGCQPVRQFPRVLASADELGRKALRKDEDAQSLPFSSNEDHAGAIEAYTTFRDGKVAVSWFESLSRAGINGNDEIPLAVECLLVES